MVNNPVYRIVVRNRWGNPYHQFMVEAPPVDDSFEYVKEALIKKNLKIECRGINGVTFVRRTTKEEPMKILILEDDEMVQRTFSRAFQKHELIQAYDLLQADIFFSPHSQSIDVVAVDGCVENTGKKFDTEPFIRQVIASGFKGPIIAISGSEDVREDMLRMGCSHECEKHELKQKLAELGYII